MKKILSMMSLVLMLLAFGWSQQAVAKTVYFQPNSNWKTDGARFALYVFGSSGDQWNDLTAIGSDGVYQASFDDTTYPNMIFVRMNGGTTENNWDNKWNQSGDLTAPAEDYQLYTLDEGAWDNGNFTITPYFGYTTGFETPVSPLSDHAFSMDRDWKHIVDYYEDSYGDREYMSYSYGTSYGADGTNGLLAYAQYKNKTLYDLLVTPKVSGTVIIQVKGSISASSSYPSFIQFYNVNEKGTEYGDQITNVKYYDADGNEVTQLNDNSFVTAMIEVAEETRIGIRAQNVYIDNFAAQSAIVLPEKKLTISSAVPSATNGTIYWDQQENGKVLVKYTVTVTNSGEVAFATGDEDYSVSIFNRKTGDVYVTTPIPVALAAGETSDEFDVSVEVEPTLWPNSYTYINMDLRENISGNEVQRAQSNYKAYEPKFVFREGGSSSTSNLYGDIAFGKVTEETSKTYEIYNDGNAPLQVKTITVPEGFVVDNAGNFTVAAKEKQTITITLPVTTPGIFSGNLEIVYVDKNGADVTYTKGITGTVLDASKNVITFDDGAGNAAYPQGSVRFTTYISSEGSGSSKNYYLQGTGSNPLYITPLMTAEEGENIAFDAEYTSYSGKVEVMISTDRLNWTTIQTISNIASSYNWTTYTAQIPDAGNYYIGFKLTSSKIDNIYGLVYAEAPEHDLLIVGSNIPTTGTQNTDYTATVNVGNVGPNVENAGEYTATLYVDGEAVATSNSVNLPVAVISGNYNNGEEENYTTLSFTFKPHTVGTLPAYIELKAGETVVKTAEVEVTIAEEKASAEAGTAVSGTVSNAPLHLLYCNSETVALYTGEMLGLKNGDKIQSITYRAYCTSDKEVITDFSAYYEWTSDESQDQPASQIYDTEGMTPIVENVSHSWEQTATSGSEMVDYITFTFDEPLVYDGKNLRMVLRSINPEGNGTNNYKSVTFEKANVTGNWCYGYSSDGDRTLAGTHSRKDLPAIHLGLVVETPKLFGTVDDVSGKTQVAPMPLAGAKVTIRSNSDDVEYTGITDEYGNYCIDIIQKELVYDEFFCELDGYATENYTERYHKNVTFNNKCDLWTENFPYGDGDESITGCMWNFGMYPCVELTISESTYATFYYENDAYQVPDGVKAYTATKNGNTISLEDKGIYIPAGCPVVIHGEPGTYQFKWSDSSTSFTGDNDLVGSEEGGKYQEEGYKYFVLSWKNKNKNPEEVGFYYQSGSKGNWANVKAHQAYMKVSASQANEAGYIFSFDEETTEIAGVENTDLDLNAPMYNLAGQRVGKDYRGVVIQNGKKVIKK